jgi:hypothetical protein
MKHWLTNVMILKTAEIRQEYSENITVYLEKVYGYFERSVSLGLTMANSNSH